MFPMRLCPAQERMNNMELKKGFVMRQVAGEYIVVNAGADVNLHGVITLNATAAALWKRLEEPATMEELVQCLLAEFEVDEQTAAQAAAGFVDMLKERDLLV